MLIANYSYINQINGHNHSGVTNPRQWIRPHVMRNFFTSPDINPNIEQIKRDSFPTGTNPPYCLILGDKGALLSSSTYISSSGVISGNAAMGVNVGATLSGAGDISAASLSLITSIASALAGSGELTSALVGSLQMAADMAGVGDFSGSLNMLVQVAASVSGSGAVTGALRGTATLSAEITPFTELSPESLSQAVLRSVIEGSYTFEECIRLLTSVAAGKTTVVDLGGGQATVTFRSINDTVDRVVVDMDNDNRDTVTVDL